MSILHLLGALDIAVAASMILYSANLLPWNVIVACIIYLAGKVAIFHKDVASIIDAVVIVVLIFLSFGYANGTILLLCIIYLLQKAFRSFV